MAPTSTSPSRPALPHATTTGGTRLILREANVDERHFTWTLNAGEWKGPLTENAYYLREAHIGSQDITRNGGQQYWILVDEADEGSRIDAEGHRLPNILSACETIRKPSMIFKMNGETEEVVSYGIGGVYTTSEYRGKGYAKTMLSLLAQQLREYHYDGKRSGFSVLYSDIGKKFYSSLGWRAHPSSHLALPASKTTDSHQSNANVKLLQSADLKDLCQMDCEFLINHCSKVPYPVGLNARALQLPTVETMDWHHSREEFVGQYTRGRVPTIKGASVSVKSSTTASGESTVFAVWTHDFTDLKISILRFHVPEITSKNHSDIRDAIGAILQAAAYEAADWQFKEVQAWNPQDILLEAAKKEFGQDKVEVVDREEQSICSLMWYDEESREGEIEPHGIDWVGNEKYGWC